MSEHKIPIPSRVYNAAVDGHVTGADQIIDDKTGLTLDKVAGGALEEKEYISSSNNGMGRVVLRKNLVEGVNTLTQSMINQANTIYVIQYDFTLSEDITVPENCILQFEGGSIKIGTINSNDIVIVSEKKCFENIKFTGDCIKSKMYVKWWVNKYPTDIYTYTIDNTSEIRDALTCGGRRIVFPSDKYLYITETISIVDDLDIYVDGSVEKYNLTPRLDNNGNVITMNNQKRDVPCIFTKDVITMIDYRFKSNKYKYQLYIGALNLVCLKSFIDLSDKDVPILKVSAIDGTPIWGLEIFANISAPDRRLIIDDIPNHYVTYTGIEVHAGDNSDNEYVSHVRLYGYILHTYNAYRFTTDGAWFTDAQIWGDTYCVIGLNSNYGTPLDIFGTHQPLASFVNNSGTAYFKSPWIKLYGFVWDADNKTQVEPGYYLYTAKRNVIADGKGGIYNKVQNIWEDNYPAQHVEGYVYNYRRPKIKHYNALRLAMFKGSQNTKAFPLLSYTLNGTSIFTYANGNNTIKLYNHDELFPREFTSNGNTSWISNIIGSNARIAGITADSVELKCSFVINTYYRTGTILVIGTHEPSGMSIKLTVETDTVEDMNSSNKQVLVSNESVATVYYQDRINTINLAEYGSWQQFVKVELTFTYDKQVSNLILPMPIIGLIGNDIGIIPEDCPFRDDIGLPYIDSEERLGAKAISPEGYPMVWTGSYWQRYDGKTFSNYGYLTYLTPKPGSTSKGGYFLSEELQRPVYWNGTKWVDSDGYTPCYNHGTTARRTQTGILNPYSKLTADDKGFRYFDEDLGYPVYWTGTSWIKADGTTVS